MRTHGKVVLAMALASVSAAACGDHPAAPTEEVVLLSVVPQGAMG